MEPKNYEEIGNAQLNLNVKKGYSIAYKDSSMDLIVNTNEQLAEPGFQGKFKLTPGTVDCCIPSGSNKFDIKLLPDLSAHGAKLTIFPMKNGNFDFSIRQSCSKLGISAEAAYSSEKKTVNATIEPKFNFNGLQFSSILNFPGKECCGLPFHGRFRFDYKNVGLRFCLCTEKSEHRYGIFTDLKFMKIGSTVMLNEKKIKELRIFTLGTFKNLTTSIISQVLGERSLEIRSVLPFVCGKVKGSIACKSQCSFGEKIKHQSTFGIDLHCTKIHTKIVGSCNGQVQGIVETDLFSGAKVLIGASCADIKKPIKELKPQLQYGLTLTK